MTRKHMLFDIFQDMDSRAEEDIPTETHRDDFVEVVFDDGAFFERPDDGGVTNAGVEDDGGCFFFFVCVCVCVWFE
jgi:hypothetical protein